MKKILYEFRYGVALTAITVLLYACAASGTLGGGPRDTTPPQIDTSESTPNYQTNFEKQKIKLVFDEFINARSLLTNVIISPPLQYLPQFETRGKKITIEFGEEEQLKEDATYIFSFGDAIGDFRENNKMENYTFVFATGDEIDSLGFSGRVVQAYDGKPAGEVSVMLYDDLRDSAFLTQKPFYYVKSDKEGNFTFNNIRSDTFRLYALDDKNVNYYYDNESERIAFYDSMIVLTDSFNRNITLELFQETIIPDFLKYERGPGPIKLLYAQNLDHTPDYTILNINDQIILNEIVKDTLILWQPQEVDSLIIDLGTDTLLVKPYLSEAYINQGLKIVNLPAGNIYQKSPKDTFKVEFNRPINDIEENLISARDSSQQIIPLQISIKNRMMFIDGQFEIDSVYNLIFLEGALSGIYGGINDSININLNRQAMERYGDIEFTLKNINPQIPYKITLIGNGTDLASKSTTGKDSTVIKFNTIPPGKYKIGILEDVNNNARWDPGNFINKRQSEQYREITLEDLRENWELKAEYVWKENQ